MPSYGWQLLVILPAAFAAGMINSIAGGGTLLSFPALVWVGRDPLLANATNTIALWPGSLGGLFGFRREVEYVDSLSHVSIVQRKSRGA